MAEVKRGAIVISLAGHDKGDFQVVFEYDDLYAVVCDGKHRPLERPKKKRLKHLKITNTILTEEDLKSNKSLRRCLRPFIDRAEKNKRRLSF